MLAALAALATGSSLVPAFADVYSTPGGEAAVGTNGEHVSARHLAVSNGGWAGTYQGIALNTTGTASGTYAAASGTGCAFAPYSFVAVSGTGCADGAVVSASGAGPAGRNNPSGAPGLVGVSGTGCAKGSYVGASGVGCAESSTVAASGLGTANGHVAVSGGGQANGSAVAVSGWGNANGGTASVDADRTGGTATGTVWDTLRNNDVYWNMGIAPVASVYQRWVQATYPPPDPVAVAEKHVAHATAMAEIVEAQTVGDGPSGPSAASPTEDATTISDTATHGTTSQWWQGCAPAAVYSAYRHRGMPSYEQLYNEMGAGENAGTTLRTAVSVIRKYYRGPSQPQLEQVIDPLDLMARVRTAVSKYDQGIVVHVNTAYLPWWSREDGTPRPGNHAIAVYQYMLRKSDPSTSHLWGWDSGYGGGSGTSFHTFAHLLVFAMTVDGGEDQMNIIW